jgi:hypothetical protein
MDGAMSTSEHVTVPVDDATIDHRDSEASKSDSESQSHAQADTVSSPDGAVGSITSSSAIDGVSANPTRAAPISSRVFSYIVPVATGVGDVTVTSIPGPYSGRVRIILGKQPNGKRVPVTIDEVDSLRFRTGNISYETDSAVFRSAMEYFGVVHPFLCVSSSWRSQIL